MSTKTQLTPQQRAQLFAMSTRQNKHMLAKETASTTPKTLSFTLPKARLLSGLLLRVKGKVNVTGSPASEGASASDIYNVIRRISLDLNNGFAPFVLSGAEAWMYNMITPYSQLLTNGGNVSEVFTAEALTSAGEHAFDFVIPLRASLNARDPIGLILLQNDQTNVTLTVDLGTGAEVMEHYTGSFTADVKDVSVSVMVETFSIPANANAYPDLSVLKLVNGRKDSLASAGQQIIKLTTGTIYRKLMFRVLDEDGMPVDNDFIQSDIQLVFNQADINYSISPEMLRSMNALEFGGDLPKGVFVFDFSTAGGCVDLGGSRDYIDTANLTEFWLRFNTTGRGKVEIVTETLARLA